MNPEVEDSKTAFTWGDPNLDGLRALLKYKLDWNDTKIDSVILPVIKRSFELRRSPAKQPKIDSFFKPIFNPHKSKRVQSALNARKGKKQKQS